jgi:hypothetical protein
VLEACYATEADCQTKSAAYEPTPEAPDFDALRIATGNSAVRDMIGTRTSGIDYWLNFSRMGDSERDERITMIDIVFAVPRPWTGNVPLATNPCDGKSDEGRVAPAHPCRSEPRAYSTRTARIEDLSVVSLMVDVRRNAVVNVWFWNGASDLIEYLKRYYVGQY